MGSFVGDVQSVDLVDLISRAQKDPSDNSVAMNKIIRRFDRLAVKIGRQLTPDWMLQDDLTNEARMGLA